MPSDLEKTSAAASSSNNASNQQDNLQKPKKRRGPKGPNPLSVKKKKPKINPNNVKSKEKEEIRKTKMYNEGISEKRNSGSTEKKSQAEHGEKNQKRLNNTDDAEQDYRVKRRKLESSKT